MVLNRKHLLIINSFHILYVKIYNFRRSAMQRKHNKKLITEVYREQQIMDDRAGDCMLYHVVYAFQSESTLYSCQNVKELLARNG